MHEHKEVRTMDHNDGGEFESVLEESEQRHEVSEENMSEKVDVEGVREEDECKEKSDEHKDNPVGSENAQEQNRYGVYRAVGAVVVGGIVGYFAAPLIVSTGLYYMGFTSTGMLTAD